MVPANDLAQAADLPEALATLRQAITRLRDDVVAAA
jgi:hypothetical protein